ncbi:MAG: hypothetical protein JWM11_7198 [Planctomycetaceae bacterium]|nr:hypothetical protein [Planctomycetaceae bacterium]
MKLCYCFMISLVLLGTVDSDRVQADEPPAFPQRVLEFPTDRTVGLVYVWPGPVPEAYELMSLLGQSSVPNTKWFCRGTNRLHRQSRPETQRIEARGPVTIPPGHWCCLDLDYDAPADLAFLDALNLDGLQFIRWKSQTGMTDAAGPHIARLAGLRGLFLFRSGNLNLETFGLIGGMPNLEFLDLGSITFDDEEAIRIAKLPKLKAFRVAQSKITKVGFSSLAALPLSFLAIPAATAIGDGPMVRLNHHAHLKTLDLSKTRVTPKSFIVLATLPQLQHLVLPGTENLIWFTNTSALHFRKMTRLETIDARQPSQTECLMALSGLKELRLPDWLADVAFRQVCQMKSLTSLQMACDSLNERSLACLATLPHLEELEIKADEVDPQLVEKLTEIVSKIETLKSLKITSSHLDRDCLHRLTRLRNLQRLSLSYPALLPDDYDELKFFPFLKALEIHSSSPQFTTLQFLDQIPQLTHVNLRLHSAPVPVEEFQRFKKLTKLAFLSCDFPVNDEILPTLVGLPELSYLKLERAAITDQGAKSLAMCRNLDYFAIAGTKVTKEGITWISGMSPRTVKHLGSSQLRAADLRGLMKLAPRLYLTKETE